ncbi:MAG: DUF1566 domain-containing protein [Methylococcales bacterium]|nr:DUF1566 domain-containing protein [Methylococcales bacterium]
MCRRRSLTVIYLVFFGYWMRGSFLNADVISSGCFDMTHAIPCADKAFPRQAGDLVTPEAKDRFRTQAAVPVVFDQQTRLYWMQCTLGDAQESVSCGKASLKSWAEATQACQSLHLDNRQWRLPTIMELNSLLQLNQAGIKIAQTIFTDTYPANYWTQSVSLTVNIGQAVEAEDSTDAWYIDFANGNIFGALKTMPMYARCVSASATPNE